MTSSAQIITDSLAETKQKPCTKCGVVQPLDCYALVKNRHSLYVTIALAYIAAKKAKEGE